MEKSIYRQKRFSNIKLQPLNHCLKNYLKIDYKRCRFCVTSSVQTTSSCSTHSPASTTLTSWPTRSFVVELQAQVFTINFDTGLRLIQTATVSCGKCRRLRKTHASDAAVCGKIQKILISKKKFAVSCGRLNEPLHFFNLAFPVLFLLSSVTRYGEISPIVQDFRSLGQK